MYLVLTILVYQCQTQYVLLRSFWWIRSFKLLRLLTRVLALVRSISTDLMWTFKSINITTLSLSNMTKAMYLYLLIFPVFTPAYYSCFHSPWVLSLKNMFRLISNIYLYIPNETNVKVLSHETCTLGILTRYNTLSYLLFVRHDWFKLIYQPY